LAWSVHEREPTHLEEAWYEHPGIGKFELKKVRINPA